MKQVSTGFAVFSVLVLVGCGESSSPTQPGSNAGSASGGAGSIGMNAAGSSALGGSVGSGGGNVESGGGGTSSSAGASAIAGMTATAGTAGTAGAGAGGTASGGSTSGAGGLAAASGAGAGAGAGVSAACSEATLRTGPPLGKEAFAYPALDARFPFSGHWLGEFSADPRFIGGTSLADLDHDGDLDFVSAQREDVGGGVIVWEYCSADHWVRHPIGKGHTFWAGGSAADFDGDGFVDLIIGDSWYKNPKDIESTSWQRFPTVNLKPEEIIVGDVTGDGKAEALYVHRSFAPRYYYPKADATQLWSAGPAFANPQQQGGAIGDIDGDGDNDVLVGYRWWYRNVNGDGSVWQTVTIFASGFADEPLTALGDLDGDGDLDFAMAEHFGANLAWAENVDGKGTQFTLHSLAQDLAFLHTIVAADFDNDGDLDLLAGQNVGASFIYENTDGKGTFAKRMIAADTRGHEARVGDVDCDGDLDIASNPWGDQREGGETTKPARDHVYLKNLLVERGGKPVFDRKPYEVGFAAHCKP